MAIVDATYYAGTYRAGSAAVISTPEFLFYEKQAERELNTLTGGRLSLASIIGTVATLTIREKIYTLVLNDIKDCLCDLSEYLYKLERATATGMIQTAFGNDGQSGSFDASELTNKSNSMYSIAKKYLSGTALLHRGVDMWG